MKGVCVTGNKVKNDVKKKNDNTLRIRGWLPTKKWDFENSNRTCFEIFSKKHQDMTSQREKRDSPKRHLNKTQTNTKTRKPTMSAHKTHRHHISNQSEADDRLLSDDKRWRTSPHPPPSTADTTYRPQLQLNKALLMQLLQSREHTRAHAIKINLGFPAPVCARS